jgi:plasmid stabilization system protein ParE
VAHFTRTAAAERDLSEIWDYIAEDNESAADRTLREIDARCHLLGQHPKMGRDRSDIVPGIRYFPSVFRGSPWRKRSVLALPSREETKRGHFAYIAYPPALAQLPLGERIGVSAW